MRSPAPKFAGGLFPELRQQFTQYARLMRLDRPIGIWLLLFQSSDPPSNVSHTGVH